MSLNLSLPKQNYSWRFNPLLLSDGNFVEAITTKLKTFIEINDNGEVSDSTLWETLKVVIRGDIISYESAIKREREKRLLEIRNTLPTYEATYRTSMSSEDYNKIVKLKYEYNCILGGQINSLLLKLRQKHFELGEKPVGLLSRQLRGVQASRAIHNIKSEAGTLLTDPIEINDRFKEFYSKLYSSKCDATHSDLANFFDSLETPKLSDVARDDLDSDFTLEEIVSAIKSFPSGKASGPDGFGCEFYKKFGGILAPLLLRMMVSSKRDKILPKTLYEANIALILKKGREETDPGSYRPIALQNVDRKIITKILAGRLNRYLSSIIHPDQTGFVPGRLSFSNVRRLLNTMYVDHTETNGAAILSLDAHKAFDQVEWPYMLESLHRFGFGDSFVSWVRLIYADPMCSILTNGDRSAPFPLRRSVQQGCPLSPALFAVALEPLALAIRAHPGVVGLEVGGTEMLISLYADDVILGLKEPEKSVPLLLELITSFGKLSGYTINWAKSEFMPLSNTYTPGFLENIPFRLAKDHFTYLGLTIPREPRLLFKLNFSEFVAKLKGNIEAWKVLPLSMIGRINSIKMVSLPRFLYLCQNLPIFLTSAFFKELDSIILSYIWNYKNHRISKAHLQKAKSEGGLGLPIFRHYYWSANIRALMFWQLESPGSLAPGAPSWLNMEANCVVGSSLSALLFCKIEKLAILRSQSFVVKNAVKILNQVRKALGLPMTSVHAPICFNHSFMPSTSDRVFHAWREKGLTSIKHLYVDGHFASFDELRAKFELPHSHHFRYLQIRDYVRSKIPDFKTLPKECVLFDILRGPPDSRHLISRFVRLFDDCNRAATDRVRQAWEGELGIELSAETWEKCLAMIQSCSVSSRHQLIQFKVVHRLHYCKVKLHRIAPSVSPLCDRCKGSEGTLSHAFWLCPLLTEFWNKIFDWFSKAYKRLFRPEAELAVFGCSQTTACLPAAMQQSLMLGMIVAKRLILLEWKSMSPPCFRRWLADMASTIQMERLRFTRTNSIGKFLAIWGHFLAYLDETRTDDK